MSRLKVEYGNKQGWVTGNTFYVSFSYYIAKEYSGKTKIKALKDGKAYVKSDLSGASESYRKGDIFTVVDNVADPAGYARLKLKSDKYVTALKSYWEFV